MKKLTYVTCLSILIIGFSACASTTVPNNTEVFQFTISPADWGEFGFPGTFHEYITYLSIPAITTDVIDSGAVLVYCQVAPGIWCDFPIIEQQPGNIVTTQFGFLLGSVYLEKFELDNTTAAPAFDVIVKVVIVKQKDMPLLDGVGVDDYAAVSQALHLSN